ncbi:MAG: DNA alkylation repair protein [Planctomycetota bacterium]|nr:DNA alkylation repair protein [Planctomycetota bacterium]
MNNTVSGLPRIPAAPRAIQKGVPLKLLLDTEAVDDLAHNLSIVNPDFDVESFRRTALNGLDELELMQRGRHIAAAMQQHLPGTYRQAVGVVLNSLTPAKTDAEEFGLAEFFYLPHSYFIAEYGIDAAHNGGDDPFEMSMSALYALTTRFTAEFAIRPFLTQLQDRTLSQIREWTGDPNPHVRRLCSEGTRPRLPWGKRVPALIANPQLTIPILETLKNDSSQYVRRSVANHLGDMAKDHPETAFEICDRWLQEGASLDLKWIIRHAMRYPAKKGNAAALKIKSAAKAK